MTGQRTGEGERITHGRHCTCSACAAEDWTNPQLAACGMHGPSCPPVYAPMGAATGTLVHQRTAERAGEPPTPERIDRVARAICEATAVVDYYVRGGLLWDDLKEDEREFYRVQARAAVTSDEGADHA